MFQSKVQPVIIPQMEHGRLSGAFAAAWGNNHFHRPLFEFDAFVHGVALHDWHYGELDTLPIGEVSPAAWLEIAQKGVDTRLEEPVADIVSKLHLQRLLSTASIPGTSALQNRIEAVIIERLQQTPYSLEPFQWADRITRFCDQLAFDFSFGIPTRVELPVFAQGNDRDTTALTYQIKPEGEIVVTPWPFSVDEIRGILIAYHQDGYPADLLPMILPYRVWDGRGDTI